MPDTPIHPLQAMLDGMAIAWQRERSQTQLTLGALIAALEAMPEGTQVANLCGAHSYRGYYSDLAFEFGEGTRPASELLTKCREAMGAVFEGYKGGDFVMGALTPLWISWYGHSSGRKLMAVHADGTVEERQDD